MTDRAKITAAAIATAFLLGMFAPWDALPWSPDPASINDSTTDTEQETP
jgi:hypothetical protein